MKDIEQTHRDSIRPPPPFKPEFIDPRPAVEDMVDSLTAEVKRVADAVEAMVVLYRSEIERTRR